MIELGIQNTTPGTGNSRRYLRFDLGLEEQALLPVESILDVFPVVPRDILPMPQVPECVMGLYNRRGSILWLVDLGYLLGAEPLYKQDPLPVQWMALTLTCGEQTLGLVVPTLQDMEEREMNTLQLSTGGVFSPAVQGLLQGYFLDPTGQQVVVALDPGALMQTFQSTR